MAWHNPTIVKFHSFIINALILSVNDAIKLNFPYKHINPKYGSEANKVKSLGSMNFIVSAHAAKILIGIKPQLGRMRQQGE